jgi:hypothetical protein
MTLLGTLADNGVDAIASLPAAGRSFSVLDVLGDARIGVISARD